MTEHGRERKGERKLCSGVCWGDAVNDSSPRGEVGELQVWGEGGREGGREGAEAYGGLWLEMWIRCR